MGKEKFQKWIESNEIRFQTHIIDEDVLELAIVRYVMKEASKMFYRDYTFFLDKENIGWPLTMT